MTDISELNRQYQEILNSVYEVALTLKNAGFIDEVTMEEFERRYNKTKCTIDKIKPPAQQKYGS